MTKNEALLKVARVAMADLIGCSEPPEGMPDHYPFNACAWRDALPLEWREEAEAVIGYVYCNEHVPSVIWLNEADKGG